VDYSKLSKEQTDIGLAIARVAEKHGLNPDFVIPLFMGESGLAHIPSKKTDSAGKPIAFGVAQLTPATAARYGVPDYMSTDAEANIDAGVRYLKDLMKNKAIGNDPEKIIIGYNAGAGAPFLKSGNLEDLLPETRAHLLNVSGHSPTGELARPTASTAEGAPTATAEAPTDGSAPGFTFEEGARELSDVPTEKRVPDDNTLKGALAGAAVGSAGVLGSKALDYLAYRLRGTPAVTPATSVLAGTSGATGVTGAASTGRDNFTRYLNSQLNERIHVPVAEFENIAGKPLYTQGEVQTALKQVPEIETKRVPVIKKVNGVPRQVSFKVIPGRPQMDLSAFEQPGPTAKEQAAVKAAAAKLAFQNSTLGRIATALTPAARVAGSTLGGISAANNLGEAYANYQEEGGLNMRNIAQGVAGLGGVIGMAPHLRAQLIGGAMQGAMAYPDIYDYVTDASGTNKEQVYPRTEEGVEYVPNIPIRQPRRLANPSIAPAGSR